MTLTPVLSLTEFPFCVGACSTPDNPKPLPNVHPLQLCLNNKLGRLELSANNGLEELLKVAYALGIKMGTPSADTDFGKPYVLDFMNFIECSTKHKGAALEIGAGVGYLSALLSQKGWNIDSLEPGTGYRHHWDEYGIKVINEFFPSPNATGPYDLITFYTVLEHVNDPQPFLERVASHLKPGGKVVLSVPDCSSEIESGDPSMLLHEHYNYFTPTSLRRTLLNAGFDAIIRLSGFGRSIYACATLCKNKRNAEPSNQEMTLLRAFSGKVRQLTDRFHSVLRSAIEKGSVGVYCPARALALLPHDAPIRFFDDASELHGKYYPPFQSRIESREALFKNPVDTLFIMSRTFGACLVQELRSKLAAVNILTMDDFNLPNDLGGGE